VPGVRGNSRAAVTRPFFGVNQTCQACFFKSRRRRLWCEYSDKGALRPASPNLRGESGLRQIAESRFDLQRGDYMTISKRNGAFRAARIKRSISSRLFWQRRWLSTAAQGEPAAAAAAESAAGGLESRRHRDAPRVEPAIDAIASHGHRYASHGRTHAAHPGRCRAARAEFFREQINGFNAASFEMRGSEIPTSCLQRSAGCGAHRRLRMPTRRPVLDPFDVPGDRGSARTRNGTLFGKNTTGGPCRRTKAGAR